MLGLTIDDYATEFQAEVWPDNALAVDVFVDLQTQWRVGMSGPVGLDYAAIQPVLELHGIERDQWRDVFQSLRVMERAALQQMHKK